jgi:hypothetical protein
MLINQQFELFYGGVGRIGKASIRTLFLHVLGFPLVPRGTYWARREWVLSRQLEVTRLRNHGPSILAGYLRGALLALAWWVTVAGITMWFMPGLELYDGDPMPLGHTIGAVGGVAAGAALALASLLALLLTRMPVRGDELARRAIFEDLLGSAVDPSLLVDPWSARDDLKSRMATVAERAGWPSTFDQWHQVALAPEQVDPTYLRLALTVARLARAAPERGPEKDLVGIEQSVWARLCEIDPGVRQRKPRSA